MTDKREKTGSGGASEKNVRSTKEERRISKKKKAALRAALVITVAVCASVFYIASGEYSWGRTDGVEFHFIYVGQGDATLIRCPGGDILVDAGPNSSEEMLDNYLRAAGVKSLRMLFVTHADEDHIGGTDMIVRNYAPAGIYLPDPGSPEPDSRALTAEAARCGLKLRSASAGQVFLSGNLRIDVLAPLTPLFGDPNADSLVLLVTVGNTSVMLTGDAEKETEERLINEYGDSLHRCDILKAGHHGSSTSSSEEWQRAVSPAVAVISCGKNNPYGHPHAAVLSRFFSMGIEVVRTDREGDVVFVSDGVKLTRKYRSVGADLENGDVGSSVRRTENEFKSVGFCFGYVNRHEPLMIVSDRCDEGFPVSVKRYDIEIPDKFGRNAYSLLLLAVCRHRNPDRIGEVRVESESQL